MGTQGSLFLICIIIVPEIQIKKELNEMIKLFMDLNIQKYEDFAKTLCRGKLEVINSSTIIGFRYDVKKSNGDVSAYYIS